MGAGPEHLHHRVQFFENADALAERVAQFLLEGLQRGANAVAIARAVHLAAIEHQLAVAGIDVATARSLDKLVLIDAQEVIENIVVDGRPDAAKFQELARTRMSAGRDVQIYGEVVDILWERGQRDAMFELEELWTRLLREQPMTLLCGYRLGAFGHDLDGFDRICSVHEGRHPGYGALAESIDAAHAIRMLEQRAVTLELEVERRRRADRRMQELLVVTTELAAASDRETVAKLVVESSRMAVGAAYAGAWLLDGDALVLVSASEASQRVATRFERVPLAAEFPATRAFRTGEPVFLANLGEYAERFPDSFQRLAALNQSTYRAFALLPFHSHGAVTGVISYTYDHDHPFEESERTFMTLLARQCGIAFERIRHAEAEKASRADVELLYELIATSNRLDKVEDVYAFALRSVMRGTKSDRSAILLFDKDDVLRFKASEGLSATYCAAVEGHTPWKRTDLYPAPISVNDAETDLAWTAYRDVFRAEGIRALAFVPIINHRRELIGKFMLYRNEARPFSAHDIQLTATVAVHVAQALERKRKEKELSRAYREEREARLLADEAIAAREEILAVVSHDLRNPVGGIMIAASSLLNLDAGEKTVRVRMMAERIHRAAERMARFITDLVDFAGIEGGRLELARAPHHPESILTAASDLFSPIAIERGLRFETRALQDLPAIECDSDRAVQVLTSLVSNALKVTPKGGAVSIGAEVKGKDVVFFVRDTGPGIEADELPKLFERHWRSKSSSYKGAGLALAIARGIVDAHGGKIWAESRLGSGSTFYFSLTGEPRN
jgi:signal transduction histidine kinase